jgi:D-arabinose 5-phosphate isomerase GutQ
MDMSSNQETRIWVDPEEVLELGKHVFRQEIKALESIADSLDEAFYQCTKLICECQGFIWVTAVGTSAAVASRFAHLLTCCGARAMFLAPADGLHGHMNVMRKEDILIAISRGGESVEVNQMVAIANKLGSTTVAFVNNTDSSMGRACDFVLPIPSKQEYELMGYLATTSTVAFSVMCDALCTLVAQDKGFTAENFALIHPGGAVGKVLGHVQSEPGQGSNYRK